MTNESTRPVVVPQTANASEMNSLHGEAYGVDWVYPACHGERCLSTDGAGHSRECIAEAGATQGWTPTEADYAGCGASAPAA